MIMLQQTHHTLILLLIQLICLPKLPVGKLGTVLSRMQADSQAVPETLCLTCSLLIQFLRLPDCQSGQLSLCLHGAQTNRHSAQTVVLFGCSKSDAQLVGIKVSLSGKTQCYSMRTY